MDEYIGSAQNSTSTIMLVKVLLSCMCNWEKMKDKTSLYELRQVI